MKIDRARFLAAVTMLSSAACVIQTVPANHGNGAPTPGSTNATPTTTAPAAEGGPALEGRAPASEGGPATEGRGPTTEGVGPVSEGRGPASEGSGPAGEGVLDPASAKACDAYAIGPCAEGQMLSDSCRDTATWMKPAARAKYLACLQTDLAPVKVGGGCASVSSKCSSANAQCKPLADVYQACSTKVSNYCNGTPEVKQQDTCWRDCNKSMAGLKDAAARKSAYAACRTKCGDPGQARNACLTTQNKSCETLNKPLNQCWEQAEKACTPPPNCVAPIGKACQAGYTAMSNCADKASK